MMRCGSAGGIEIGGAKGRLSLKDAVRLLCRPFSSVRLRRNTKMSFLWSRSLGLIYHAGRYVVDKVDSYVLSALTVELCYLTCSQFRCHQARRCSFLQIFPSTCSGQCFAVIRSACSVHHLQHASIQFSIPRRRIFNQ